MSTALLLWCKAAVRAPSCREESYELSISILAAKRCK